MGAAPLPVRNRDILIVPDGFDETWGVMCWQFGRIYFPNKDGVFTDGLRNLMTFYSRESAERFVETFYPRSDEFNPFSDLPMR